MQSGFRRETVGVVGSEVIPKWHKRPVFLARSPMVRRIYAMLELGATRRFPDPTCGASDSAFHYRMRFYGLCGLYIFLAGTIAGILAGTSYAGENTREIKCVGRGYGSAIVCLCSFLSPNRDQERLFFLRDDLQGQ